MDARIKILLSILGVLAIGFIGITLWTGMDESSIPIYPKNSPEAVAKFTSEFASNPSYNYDKDISKNYLHVIEKIINKGNEKQTWINKISGVFANRIAEEIKDYCQHRKFSNEFYNRLRDDIKLIPSSCEKCDELPDFEKLKSLEEKELNKSKEVMGLSYNYKRQMNKHTALFSESYDWSNTEVDDWYKKKKSSILGTAYVSQNPTLRKYFDDCKNLYDKWYKTRTLQKKQYVAMSSILQAYNGKDYARAITQYMLCKDFTIESLKTKCTRYKQRAFIEFMGCGVSQSSQLTGSANIECLKEKRSMCRKLKSNTYYFNKCDEFTDH